MEKIEQVPKIEINSEELLKTIDEIEWEEHYEFSYNGSDYILLLDTEEEADPETGGAEYHQSTATPGAWDIYILETLSGEERKRKLFHEILECNLKDQGIDHEMAHNTAKQEEEKTFGNRQEKND